MPVSQQVCCFRQIRYCGAEMEAFLKSGKLGTSNSKPAKPSTSGGATSSQKKKRNIPTPWVEKYRPRCVDDVVYQEEVVAMLKKSVQGADLPNLLFYGPPGTGKTSTILALAREIFGDIFRTRTLELNASDERGIQVIRDKVKVFAQQTASSVLPDGRKCPPFKIIILDEADSMTNAAQAALRRTMEKESKSTRFCLICNYVSRIIEPLTSRCSKFRFKPLSKETVINRLSHIAQEENLKYHEGVLDAVVKISEGDLRKAITILQCAYRLKGENDVTLSDIDDISGVVPVKTIEGLIAVCQADSYEKLDNYVTDLIYEGYSVCQVLNQLHDAVLSNMDFNDKQKSIVCEKIAISDRRLMDGADEYLQLMSVCCVIIQQICHSSD